MKRISLIALMFFAVVGFASAQIITQGNDVLGAHLNYGRGCPACHAPHSGVYGNGGIPSKGTDTGSVALWGEDASPLYGVTITTGQSEHGSYAEPLPSSLGAGTPDVSGVLMCLSCHDGNLARGAMMKGVIYESVNPATYGGNAANIPTFLGNDGTFAGNYLNDHPVGLNAAFSCTGSYNWDCSISATGAVSMNGPNSSRFVTDYGMFVSFGVNGTTPVVLCTTCHNQHVMNVVNITASSKSGLPIGTYQTMFFLRGPYNPNTTTAGSNQNAQFCRQCHGGESNEANGSTAKTIF